MTDLFIGVVSHEGSRFSVNQGPLGLAAQLSARLSDLHVSCVTRVNTRDGYDASVLPIDRSLVRSSLSQQLHLEEEWARFLSVGRPGRGRTQVGAAVAFCARRLRQMVAYEATRLSLNDSQSPGVQMIRRLINIELSHLDLWQAGLDSKARWVLILEDDASSPDPGDCAAGLAELIARSGSTPAYVNLSISFTPAELGVEHLVSESADASWAGSVPRTILVSSRPVTNTVCAIAYRSDFVAELLREFALLPMTPVVPIDWKLNLALMRMYKRGDIAAGDCWLVEPGPIVQMSMQTEVGA